MNLVAYQNAVRHVERGDFVFIPAPPSDVPFYWCPMQPGDYPDLWHHDIVRRCIAVVSGAFTMAKMISKAKS